MATAWKREAPPTLVDLLFIGLLMIGKDCHFATCHSGEQLPPSPVLKSCWNTAVVPTAAAPQSREEILEALFLLVSYVWRVCTCFLVYMYL